MLVGVDIDVDVGDDDVVDVVAVVAVACSLTVLSKISALHQSELCTYPYSLQAADTSTNRPTSYSFFIYEEELKTLF